MLTNHVLLIAIYAALTGAFFALLSKSDRRHRWRLFAIVSGVLFGGAVVVAWMMFPFPLR